MSTSRVQPAHITGPACPRHGFRECTYVKAGHRCTGPAGGVIYTDIRLQNYGWLTYSSIATLSVYILYIAVLVYSK